MPPIAHGSAGLFILKRMEERPRSTWGYLYPPGADRYGHLCMTMERGERDPERRPRIPAGTYRLAIRPLGLSNFDAALKTDIKDYRGIIEVLDVPRRKLIEIVPSASPGQLQHRIGVAENTTRGSESNWNFYGKSAAWAYRKTYPPIAQACAAGDAWLKIIDITQ